MVSMWATIIGLSLTLTGAVVTVTAFIITMKGDIKANMTAVDTLEDMHCRDLDNVKQAMQVRNEFNDGVYKEIKEELKSLHELMMQLIQKMPKRSED